MTFAQYSTGVTTNGTPGSSGYTQIVVLKQHYYIINVVELMGSRIDIQSSTSVIDSSTAFVDSTGTAITFGSQAFSIVNNIINSIKRIIKWLTILKDLRNQV